MSTSNPSPEFAKWLALLTHPVTVGVLMWAFIPVGLVLLSLNPALRKDRKWWAAAGVWALYLLWVGRMPLVSSTPDAPLQARSASTSGQSSKHRNASSQPERTASSPTGPANSHYDNGYAYGLEMADACKRLARGSLGMAREQAAKWHSELRQTLREAHPQQGALIQLTRGKLEGLSVGLADTALLP